MLVWRFFSFCRFKISLDIILKQQSYIQIVINRILSLIFLLELLTEISSANKPEKLVLDV
jgi:hypothetical protein